ncbi:MAG: 2OG-Fe(II) oxygenase [Deltaproteobacteria bacterium]|nr:MAG: 2OG-Fe(II) oxygenase [Deltaproteobacteria bacterium]
MALRALAPLSESDVDELAAGRLVIRDNAFGEDLARRSREVLLGWREQGRLDAAGVGRGGKIARIRSDLTAWVQPDDPELTEVFVLFEGLRQGLTRDLRLSLQRFAVQAACYEQGAAYGPHFDAFRGDHSRRVTAIWYLNPNWRPEWGGQLRAHLPEGPVDVLPRLDRLVIFLSEQVKHEVLPALAPRFAMTSWYRGAEPLPLLPDPRFG